MKTIAVDDDALEKLDKFIKWCYYENIYNKNDDWVWGEDADYVYGIPKTLMSFAKPIAKSFGLYPYNQKEVRHP